MRRLCATAFILCATAPTLPALGAVLPDDRADILYHRYDGGGVTVDGPSLLVQKKFAEKYAVSANYYVDMVSSASIDVVTTASPYKETRTQGSLGFAMLNGSTEYNVNYTLSDEYDYRANTASFDLSQDMFGGLTTVSFGFSRGWDDVRKHGDKTFAQTVDHRNYRLGLSQILTKQLIMGLNYEVITDEGYLNNPYRSVRYLDPGNPLGYAYQPEVYPRTRNSNAIALDARYYLNYRASVHGSYRYYTDSWGIVANTVQVGYTQPWRGKWLFELGYRWYDQSAADFYSDLFPGPDAQNFLARDKELSSFTSNMFSVGATYELPPPRWKFLERSTLNLFYDRIHFDYSDFRDLRKTAATPGTEPLYQFDADVIRLFYSGWF
jgi:hypothetical protein